MQLLVAYRDDPAGSNMAGYLAQTMKKDGKIWHGSHYDLTVIETPAISADWLDAEFEYDGYVFLSKHAAESGRLALTAHSTGNFGAEARFGGNPGQVAIPHPDLQKAYMRRLYERRSEFPGFEITIETTHHGPTALDRPVLFVEVGTTGKEWNDRNLCGRVAQILDETLCSDIPQNPAAIALGGPHYPERFTREIISGRYALGTVMPRRALDSLDDDTFVHILQRNADATAIICDGASARKRAEDLLRLVRPRMLEVCSS